MHDNIYILILSGRNFEDRRLKPCLDSWVSHFKNFLISTDKELSFEAPHIVATEQKDGHSCPPKIFRGIEKILEDPKGCDWLFIADDDTFVNHINLTSFARGLNAKDEALYGRDMTGFYPFKGRQIHYLSGGGGTLLPIKTAEKMIDTAKERGWMDWLVEPRRIPAKHKGGFPTQAGADTKLGWIAEQLKIKQYNLRHLFHPESYAKYKKDAASILECITYHRQYGDAQTRLNEIVNREPQLNTLDLTPPKPKPPSPKEKERQKVVSGNNPPVSYYLSTELLLLRKKVKKLEAQVESILKS